MSLILDEQFLSGFVTQSELDAYTGRLAAARERLHTPDGQPKGWRTLPCDTGEELLSAVETAARTIREEADILLVIGIGGSYLGAKAALDFLPGANGPEVLFLGNDMSPSHLSEVLSRCEGREIAVNVISKSGSTTEPASCVPAGSGTDAAAIWQRGCPQDLVHHRSCQRYSPADV